MTPESAEDGNLKPLSWRARRQQVEVDCKHIASSPEDQACADRIRQYVRDSKWEIRKVLAESLTSFPEALARELAAGLAKDSNAMVSAAAQRSIGRKSPASALSSSHSSVIQAELERIERKFGTEARQAAFRLAERTAFLHVRTAVHDIKNILTHLNVDIEVLLIAAPGETPRLQRLVKGREYLVKLIHLMEDYSRDIEMDFRTEDLVELAHEAVHAAREQVFKEGKESAPVECTIEAPDSLIVSISRFHFAMVLTNLIKNAIQSHAITATELGSGRVSITVSSSEDGAQISIVDTGRGIAPGDLQRLLDFVPGSSSKPGGMGYGLPICRKYTEAHGGKLNMRSEENKGTEVVIVLPERQVT